jgi:hypothetical protein
MVKQIDGKKNELWLKASVIGGLWASMEIIVGSFLHNTRLPFAGSILAFAGTVLLIGFYQIWPVRGLIFRAGFITAMMKSVSPSAIILGPMTGILMEALLIEMTLWLLGNHVVSVSVAGILSLSSALFHKIISVLILYGFDIIKVYVNIINFGLKQMGVKEAAPLDILKVLLFVYVLFGIMSGLMGYFLGKKARKLKAEIPAEIRSKGVKEKEFFEMKEQRESRLGWLIFHLISIPLVLYLFNRVGWGIGLLAAVLYLLPVALVYRKSMRRLRKPVFWSQLLVILVLSTLFWNVQDAHGIRLSQEGLLAGLEMMVRATFIIVAFSALSVELRNEKVKGFLERIGVGKFYEAISLAFGALPQMIALLPTAREIIKEPVRSLLKPLVYADSWLEIFKRK